MRVYLDEMFLCSFLMDAVILKSSALILRKKIGFRIIPAASLGAMYDCTAFFWALISIWPCRLAVAAVMVMILFGRSSAGEFLMRFTVFFVVSFLSAGIMAAVVYTGGAEAVIRNNSVYIRPGWVKWLFGAGLCVPVSVWGIRRLRALINRRIYRAKIRLNEREIETELLADTGNCLREPIGGRPVIVAEWAVMKELFPEAGGVADLAAGEGYRIRAVPFRAVGAKGTLLSVDTEVEILDGSKYVGKVPVAIVEKPLSKNGEYHGLLQSELL